MAARTGLPVAHMMYRIGRGYHLFRAQGAEYYKGGLMVVDTDGFSGGGPTSALVLEIIDECRKRNFLGIVLDTGGRAAVPLPALTVHLASDAHQHGLKLYVPEALAAASDLTIVLVPTALSGGTLADHIGEALKKYGPGRVALEIERVRMDFSLPAMSGTGRELTAEEFQALQQHHHAQSFFSKDLCAYYFSYHDKTGVRFVLYDNAASIKRKLSVGAKLGITDAFIFYPHVADIIDKIVEA
jgi:predicted alpha/beta-fold hydrolase